MGITNGQFDHWSEHGFVVVPNFLTPAQVEEAQQEVEALLGDEGITLESDFHFPRLGPTMNRLAAHSDIVAFVERALGTRDIMLTQSMFWPKRAGSGDYDQELHLDFYNNSLVVPRADGDFRQISMLVYYSDVTEELGPLHAVSRRFTRDRSDVAGPVKHGDPLYTHEQPVTAPAGSLVIWGMQTWHRGSAFKVPEGHRYAHFLVYRAAAHQWMGFGPDFAGEGLQEGMARFLVDSTPRDRELVGFPAVGHPYWNEKTIEGVSIRYPEMDMAPYIAGADA